MDFGWITFKDNLFIQTQEMYTGLKAMYSRLKQILYSRAEKMHCRLKEIYISWEMYSRLKEIYLRLRDVF